jgi:hypothetical protein
MRRNEREEEGKKNKKKFNLLESHFQSADFKTLLFSPRSPEFLEVFCMVSCSSYGCEPKRKFDTRDRKTYRKKLFTKFLRVSLPGDKALLADTTPVAIFRVVVGICVEAYLVAAAGITEESTAASAMRLFLKEIP